MDVPRPPGDFILTDFHLEVLDVDGNFFSLRKNPDKGERSIYFHHAVLHEWDRESRHPIHHAQMLFLSSPDMVASGTWYTFPEGYGIIQREEDPAWGLCLHAINYLETNQYLRLNFSMEYREIRPTDKALVVQFLGGKIYSRALNHNNHAEVVESSYRGQIEPEHGGMELVAFQWHLHNGVMQASLERRNRDLETQIISHTTTDERTALSNGIYEFPIEYFKGVVIQDDDALYTKAVARSERAQEALSDGDPLMQYVLVYGHYLDNWRNHGLMYYLNDRSPWGINHHRPHTPA